MTTKKQKHIINYWLNQISDDYMHFNQPGFENAYKYAQHCKIKEYEDKGVMMWSTILDIDNIVKTAVLLFYVKPEYRGSKIFLTMIQDIERIAVEEGSKQIIIGGSVSGYKEEKFNKIFTKFGYIQAGYIKKV